VTHFPRHGLGKHLLQRLRSLARAVARRQDAVDLCRSITVETEGKLRPVSGLHLYKCRQRHRLPIAVAHTELADAIRLGAELALGLNVYLPHPSEAIEVIDKDPSHEGL